MDNFEEDTTPQQLTPEFLERINKISQIISETEYVDQSFPFLKNERETFLV